MIQELSAIQVTNYPNSRYRWSMVLQVFENILSHSNLFTESFFIEVVIMIITVVIVAVGIQIFNTRGMSKVSRAICMICNCLQWFLLEAYEKFGNAVTGEESATVWTNARHGRKGEKTHNKAR